METFRHYLKAEIALVSQLLAMGLTWALTGSFSEAELVQTVTALVSSALVVLVSNGPKPPEPEHDNSPRI